MASTQSSEEACTLTHESEPPLEARHMQGSWNLVCARAHARVCCKWSVRVFQGWCSAWACALESGGKAGGGMYEGGLYLA
eukprot:CAMPEP_0183332728 /NCGR_PEP_ID=MMETSP0164_2-20130417/1818_1 /TAXON_ID=221442 /ORGANISM="Coccolithus pelagicus ssp braarudi, Strain PLY182g" /LENGTH=79 /DNA_ID=CAMNT_0025501507 /DNA_START=133 /DNA_END=369 /DNA_ORIENTATION=-